MLPDCVDQGDNQGKALTVEARMIRNSVSWYRFGIQPFVPYLLSHLEKDHYLISGARFTARSLTSQHFR